MPVVGTRWLVLEFEGGVVVALLDVVEIAAQKLLACEAVREEVFAQKVGDEWWTCFVSSILVALLNGGVHTGACVLDANAGLVRADHVVTRGTRRLVISLERGVDVVLLNGGVGVAFVLATTRRN